MQKRDGSGQVSGAVVARVKTLPEELKLIQERPHDVRAGRDEDVLLVAMDRLLRPVQGAVDETTPVDHGKLVVHEVGVAVVADLDPVPPQLLHGRRVHGHLVPVRYHPHRYSPSVRAN